MSLIKESDFLRKVPLFQDLEPSKLKLLAFASEMITYQDGEILFEAGDVGDCAYVITQGQVEILSDSADAPVVGVMKENQIFGEMALLNNETRSATLRARGELIVLKITEGMFMQLIRESSGLALTVLKQLSQKLARSHNHAEQLQKQLKELQPGQV